MSDEEKTQEEWAVTEPETAEKSKEEKKKKKKKKNKGWKTFIKWFLEGVTVVLAIWGFICLIILFAA